MKNNVFFIILITYLLVINIITSLVFIYDKSASINNKWRIPERVLWLLSLAGGALFAYLTMITIRHKTQKKDFKLFMPTLMFLQIILLFYIIKIQL